MPLHTSKLHTQIFRSSYGSAASPRKYAPNNVPPWHNWHFPVPHFNIRKVSLHIVVKWFLNTLKLFTTKVFNKSVKHSKLSQFKYPTQKYDENAIMLVYTTISTCLAMFLSYFWLGYLNWLNFECLTLLLKIFVENSFRVFQNFHQPLNSRKSDSFKQKHN